MPLRGVVTASVAVAATLAAVVLVERGGAAIFLLCLALVACICLQPLAGAIARIVGRGAGIAISALLGIVVTTTALGGLAWELDRQASSITDAVGAAVEDLDPDSTAATWAERIDVADRVEGALDGFATRIVIGADDPIAAAGVFGRIVVVFVLAGFMLAGGGSLLTAGVHLARRTATRARLHAGLRAAHDRAGPFFRRTVMLSLVHGALAALWCATTDLPGPISLGAWVAVASMVPILGASVGWALIAGIASARGESLWLVVLVAAVVITADRIVRRRYIDPRLRPGPLLTLLGLAAGAFAAGPAGALVGLYAVAAFSAFVAAQDASSGDVVVQLVEGQPEAWGQDGGSPEDCPVVAVADGGERLLRLRLSNRSAVVAAVLVAGAWASFRLGQQIAPLIIWIAVATLITFGLDRPIAALCVRTKAPRWAAVAAVLSASAVALGVLAVFAGPSVADSAGSIVGDAPETVESLESLPLVGDVLRERDASAEVEQWLTDLPDRVGDSAAVGRVAKAAGDGLLGAGLIISLVVAALLDGPRLVRALDRRVPVSRRREVRHLGSATYRTISRVAAAAALVATLNGTVVMTLALVLGIPLAVVLGVWAAGWNFVPQVGGFIGALPLVALGFGQSPAIGSIALVTFVGYQTFENHVIQPIVGSRAVDLPPLVMMIGVLIGGALAGFVGALMAGPTLGVAKAALDELRPEAVTRIDPPST
ncbi:MAG: AI-2E family transporter [Actinomycetota bacterium]|nr:AI-2E family transporter [Actinomycetota bacterium]